MSLTWYVLKSKPNKEDFLCGQLESKELDYFYPCYSIIPVNPRSRKIRPYFPGYIFVRTDLEALDHPLVQWIPGAVGLVAFDGCPATISDAMISALRTRVKKDSQEFKDERKFHSGEKVEILNGPFEGYEGIFDTNLSGNERVRILIELLRGKPFKVDLPVRAIKKIKPCN